MPKSAAGLRFKTSRQDRQPADLAAFKVSIVAAIAALTAALVVVSVMQSFF